MTNGSKLFALCIFIYLKVYAVAAFSQTGDWKNSAFNSLDQIQYNFHCGQNNSFEAANKASGLSITCLPLTQTISSRHQFSSFTYSLQLASIHSGAFSMPLLDEPHNLAAQNKLTQTHRYFSIQYINDQHGLKQNFILFNKVNNNPVVELNLNVVSNDCYPVLYQDEISIQQRNAEVAQYKSLKVYDAHGVVLPAVFSVKQNTICIRIDHQNAVYPLTVDPLSTTANTHVQGSQSFEQMAYCVSTAGDVNGDGYTDVIVGAPLYDNVEINEGAAFVYLGSANGISSIPAWMAEGDQSSAHFGINVSEAGDVNGDGFGDIIVGAEWYDNGELNEGKVYVYHGSATGLSATPNWTFESNQANAHLGFIVSTAGDVNGDGYSDVIVGAPDYDNGQADEGVAYIFHGSASGLGAAPNATLEQNQAGSSFGWSVSSAGDINNDGFADVLVSAVYFDAGQTDEGKVWLYTGSASGINTTPNWAGEGNQVEAYYGENISWAGDLNGDGYGDVVIGADFRQTGQTDEGQVFVYYSTGTTLPATQNILLERDQASAGFGVGVNGAGDVNGDGYGDLIVGAYFYDNGQTNEGAAFIYYGSSTGVSQTRFTQFESNQAGAHYGISVCSAGDVNGDGLSDVIVGAYLWDVTSPSLLTDAGSFFVYHGCTENIGTSNIMSYASTQAGAAMGNFVTCIGDVNRDGFSDLAVGANMADAGATDNGVVYIFHGSATGYAVTPNTTLTGPAINNTRFGSSIGAAGDVNGDGFSDIVVGAPGYTNGHTSEGAFFVYLGSSSGLNTSAHLSVEANMNNAALGFSVSGAGDVNGDGYSDVIVGANGYTAGQANEGIAYVYYGSATGVDATPDWQYETNVSNERFGACVVGAGDLTGDGYSDIAVFSSGYSNGQTNEGRFHIFTGSDTGLTATPVNVFETDIANAGIHNQSSSFVGDINGDGFCDLVFGVSSFNNGGTANEGLLRIYYGATPNLNFSTIQNIEGNSAQFLLGAIVGFGGDVNGDGYNDVITGSPTFNGGLANEGIARIYLGSASGLASSPVYSIESNVAATGLGSSVTAAGDLNGDGYSDIAIGASLFDETTPSALTDAGRTYVFYGNNSHNVQPMTMSSRQFKSDLLTVVQTSNGTFEANCNFGIGQTQKAHLGRERARLLYEIRGHPHPFSNASSVMNTSVSQSGIQGSYTNLALTGSVLTMGVTSSGFGFPKWRARVNYHPTDAIDGQMYGRWFYGGIHDKQDRSIKVAITTCGLLPVELSQYRVECSGELLQVRWEMKSEDNIAGYVVYTSTDGEKFDGSTSILSTGNAGVYNIALENSTDIRLVKLVTIDNNQYAHEQFTVATRCAPGHDNQIHVYPNPSSQGVYVSLIGREVEANEVLSTSMFDLSGRLVYQADGMPSYIDVSSMPPGIYCVTLLTMGGKKFSARFVRM